MDDDDRYTTFEAKARFSEVLKKVREGRTITVTYRGEAVAEIRPLDRSSGTLARLEWLESRGVIGPAGRRLGKLGPVARRPGALKRFLDERD
jgi:prevent-host-death family protein